MCIQQLIEEKTRQSSPRCVDFSPLVAFFLVPPREPSCFLASICLAWPSDSCSVCQLVASGTLTRGQFAGIKREGSSRGSANTSVSVLHPDCPSAQQGKKRFPTHYCFPFVRLVVEGMLVEKWGLFTMHLVCMQALYIVLEQSIY